MCQLLYHFLKHGEQLLASDKSHIGLVCLLQQLDGLLLLVGVDFIVDLLVDGVAIVHGGEHLTRKVPHQVADWDLLAIVL